MKKLSPKNTFVDFVSFSEAGGELFLLFCRAFK